MNQTRLFRLFIVSGFAFSILGSGVDYLVPGLMPDAVREAIKAANGAHEIHPWFAILMALVMLFLVVAGLASTIGLLLFRRWARGLAVWVSVISLLTYPALGPMAYSGWAMLMIDVSMALWGAALAMAYFSELRVRFDKPLPV